MQNDYNRASGNNPIDVVRSSRSTVCSGCIVVRCLAEFVEIGPTIWKTLCPSRWHCSRIFVCLLSSEFFRVPGQPSTFLHAGNGVPTKWVQVVRGNRLKS